MPFYSAIPLLENYNGEWIRSPQQWTDPKDVSRDQLDPMIMCLALYGENEYVSQEFRRHVSRYFLYPNRDISSPEHIGHFIRHKPLGLIAKILLLPCDLFLFINSFILCFWTSSAHSANDLNHIISLCHAEVFNPTFLSKWAAKLYLGVRDYRMVLHNYYNPKTGNSDLVLYYLNGLDWLKKRIDA